MGFGMDKRDHKMMDITACYLEPSNLRSKYLVHTLFTGSFKTHLDQRWVTTSWRIEAAGSCTATRRRSVSSPGTWTPPPASSGATSPGPSTPATSGSWTSASSSISFTSWEHSTTRGQCPLYAIIRQIISDSDSFVDFICQATRKIFGAPAGSRILLGSPTP